MIDSIIQDSLQLAEKTISIAADNSNPFNIWMWIALGEFGIILGLLISNRLSKSSSTKRRFKNESINQKVDFDNIINSSFHSTELFDVLKVKCHPDRFPTDRDLNTIADKLFQEITQNKTNLRRLEELKIEAQQKLKITF